MLALVTNHAIRPRLATIAEHASWMIVVAAETLAGQQVDPVERGRYAEAGRRMSHAVRQWWSDPRTLLAASPTVTGPDGATRPMVEMVSPYRDDPDSGVRAAMTLFLAADWRPAA